PVCDEVKGLCELYGFEAMDLANEGTFVLAVPQEIALGALEIMQRFGHCEQAAIIGTVTDETAGKVILKTPWNTKRYLDLPQGELLPRIC
ncbi:AIR synthase-related protein, partial [Shewanella putrefaciens]